MTVILVDTLSSAIDFGSGYSPDITELSVARTGGVTWLYGHTSNADDGFITMRISNSGDLTYIANTGASGPSIYRAYDESDPSGFESVFIDGEFRLVGSNYFETASGEVDHGLHFYEVQANGELAEVGAYDRNANTKQVSGVIQVAGEVLTVEVSGPATGSYNTLFVLNEGLGYTYTLPSFANADIFGLAKDEGDAYFFYTRADNHQIGFIEMGTSGFASLQAQIPGSGTLGAAGAATDMDAVNFGQQGFLITTNPEYGLKSYDIDGIFSTELADTVGASASVAAWEAAQIDTFKFEGRNFVVTGGQDIGVFEISAKGDFFLHETFAFTSDADGAKDIEVHAQGGRVFIVASDSTGVTTFELDPGLAQNRNGTAGDDLMVGDSRANVFSGFDGNDVLKGAKGNDVLYGNSGNDTLFGGNGNDKLRGADGNDRLFGQDKNDRLEGQKGADRLNGGSGSDRLIGGDGNDVVAGGKGSDILLGGKGKDLLIGGKGKDTLTGGSKSDVFVFSADGSKDTIRDWKSNDKLEMRGFGANKDFSDLNIKSYNGTGLSVSLEGETIYLTDGSRDLNVNDLSASDFIFG